MSITFWLPFFFASPPAHDACAARGVPLLEIRERSEVEKPITTTKIFSSGAWTLSRDGRRLDAGCFDRKELRSIRRAVQRAPWEVTTSPIACFAYDPDFTEYRVHGELRFTERMCSGKTADNVTMRAIDLVKRELAEDMGPQPMPPTPAPQPVPPPPPVRPPVVKPPVAACSATGTPLFEIRNRSDAAQPTSRVAIYSTGAWTFQPIERDGQAGALTTGCFDKNMLASLRHVITDSPWDTEMLQYTCKAYSATYTEYYVHGQLEYTARLCGAQRLDDKSLGAIKILEDELAKVLPKQHLVY